MAIDSQQRQHLGSMGYDHIPYSAGPPQFTNPWPSAPSSTNTSQFFPSLSASNLGYDGLTKTNVTRSSTMSMPYTSLPAAAPSINTGDYSGIPYNQSDLLSAPQGLMNSSRSAYDSSYAGTQPQTLNSYAPATASYVPMGSYGQSLAPQQQQHDNTRRLSQSSTASVPQSQTSFGDVLDAGRGMVAMSQDMTTPRNIYGNTRTDRDTSDSYGFPSTHSAHSSISSGSTYPSYYADSTASSVSDYSSTAESVDSVSSRTLPRPSGLNLPPAPQSMMGQFNSKVSSSTQKKHKCKPHWGKT
ncbi:MAG: hypothetical protein Q9187_005976, partial [Circinaria calcarea]